MKAKDLQKPGYYWCTNKELDVQTIVYFDYNSMIQHHGPFNDTRPDEISEEYYFDGPIKPDGDFTVIQITPPTADKIADIKKVVQNFNPKAGACYRIDITELPNN